MRLFEFTSLDFRTDNPGGQWLENEREDCNEKGTNQYGAPKRFGNVTGYFDRVVLLPVDIVSRIRGIMGEQSRTREDDLNWLVTEMGDNNRLPLTQTGKQYAPFIQVDQTGTPWVNEGNHRIKAAKILKWQYIPIELRYFAGGEEENGLLAPDRVTAYDARAISAGFKPGNEFQGTP